MPTPSRTKRIVTAAGIVCLSLFSLLALEFLTRPQGSQTSSRADSRTATERRKAADETLAMLINASGQLCAKVLNVAPLDQPDAYEVACTLYRGGEAKAAYVVNASTGSVARIPI